jgi:membrane protein
MSKQSTARPSILQLLKLTLAEWNDDNATHLAAALAYFTIFSMTPLLVIGVAIAGVFFGRDATMSRVISQVERYTYNTEAAAFVGSLIENARRPGASWVAGIISFFMLFYGASGVFHALKTALNQIWDVPRKTEGALWEVITFRMFALAMVLVSGFFLVVSLVVSTMVMAGARWIDLQWPGMVPATQAASFLVFFLLTLLVFMLIYKYVPDVRLAWSDIWIGAATTALLFSIGRWAISLYLSQSAITSTYGAAGSLAAILIWIFYSAQLFFLGAEFTQVYGRTYGSRRKENVLLGASHEPEEGDEVDAVGEADRAEWQGGLLVVASRPARQEGTADGTRSDAACAEADVDGETEKSPRRLLRRIAQRMEFTQPLVDIGMAATVLLVLSLYTVVRQPFRRE